MKQTPVPFWTHWLCEKHGNSDSIPWCARFSVNRHHELCRNLTFPKFSRSVVRTNTWYGMLKRFACFVKHSVTPLSALGAAWLEVSGGLTVSVLCTDRSNPFAVIASALRWLDRGIWRMRMWHQNVLLSALVEECEHVKGYPRVGQSVLLFPFPCALQHWRLFTHSLTHRSTSVLMKANWLSKKLASSGFPFRWKSWVQSRAMVTTAQRTPRKQCLQVCTKNRWRDPEGSQRQHRKTGTNTRTVWRLCWCNFLPLVSRCMGARWVPHSGGRSATPLKGRGKLFKVFRWLLEPCWKVRSICARTRYAKRCEKLVNDGCSALYSGVLTQSHAALFQVRGSISDTVIVSKILWQAEFSAICSMSNCWLKILKPFCKTQLAGFLPPVFPSHISKRRTHVYLTAVNPSHASVAIAAKHESTTAWTQSGREGPHIPSIATWSSHNWSNTHQTIHRTHRRTRPCAIEMFSLHGANLHHKHVCEPRVAK